MLAGYSERRHRQRGRNRRRDGYVRETAASSAGGAAVIADSTCLDSCTYDGREVLSYGVKYPRRNKAPRSFHNETGIEWRCKGRFCRTRTPRRACSGAAWTESVCWRATGGDGRGKGAGTGAGTGICGRQTHRPLYLSHTTAVKCWPMGRYPRGENRVALQGTILSYQDAAKGMHWGRVDRNCVLAGYWER